MKDLITHLREQFDKRPDPSGRVISRDDATKPTPAGVYAGIDAFCDFARDYLREHPVVSQSYAEEGIAVQLAGAEMVALTPARSMDRRGSGVMPITTGAGGDRSMPGMPVDRTEYGI